MLNENKNDAVSDNLLIETFKENDKKLIELVNRVKSIYSNTLLKEKQIKIDALRRTIVEEDISCQLKKIQIINDVLNELEK